MRDAACRRGEREEELVAPGLGSAAGGAGGGRGGGNGGAWSEPQRGAQLARAFAVSLSGALANPPLPTARSGLRYK